MVGYKSGLFPTRESHVFLLMNSVLWLPSGRSVRYIFEFRDVFICFVKSFLLELYSDLQVVLIRAAKGKDAGEKINGSKSDPWVSVRKGEIAHYYSQVVGVTVVQAGLHI